MRRKLRMNVVPGLINIKVTNTRFAVIVKNVQAREERVADIVPKFLIGRVAVIDNARSEQSRDPPQEATGEVAMITLPRREVKRLRRLQT